MINEKQLSELKIDQSIEIEPRQGGNQFPGATFKKVDGDNVLFMSNGNGQRVPKKIFLKYAVLPGVADTDTDTDTDTEDAPETPADPEKSNDSTDADSDTDTDTPPAPTPEKRGRKKKNRA